MDIDTIAILDAKVNIAFALFERAKTFQELLYLNKKFIRGELMSSFYQFEPLSDLAAVKVDLLLLNDQGVLTCGGQPGAAGTRLGVWDDDSKKFFDSLQVPCLSFYMEKGPLADKLKKALATDANIMFNIWDKKGPVLSNFCGTAPLQTQRTDKKKKNVKYAEWKVTNWIHGISRGATSDDNTYRLRTGLDIYIIFESEDFILVEAFVPEYGTSDSLEQKILSFLAG